MVARLIPTFGTASSTLSNPNEMKGTVQGIAVQSIAVQSHPTLRPPASKVGKPRPVRDLAGCLAQGLTVHTAFGHGKWQRPGNTHCNLPGRGLRAPASQKQCSPEEPRTAHPPCVRRASNTEPTSASSRAAGASRHPCGDPR